MGSSLAPWNSDFFFFPQSAFGAKLSPDFFIAVLLAVCRCQSKTMAKLSVSSCTGGSGAPASLPLRECLWEESCYLLSNSVLLLSFIFTHPICWMKAQMSLPSWVAVVCSAGPELLGAQPSVVSYSWAASGSGGSGQQRGGVAAGSSADSELERCRPDVHKAGNSLQHPESDAVVLLTEESGAWHAEKPVINVHFLLCRLGRSYQYRLVKESTHLFDLHLSFVLKLGGRPLTFSVWCVCSRRCLSLVAIVTGRYCMYVEQTCTCVYF